MEPEVPEERLEKRAHFIALNKAKDVYKVYKLVKTSDDPGTPRMDLPTKKMWEHEVYKWRCAMKSVHKQCAAGHQ